MAPRRGRGGGWEAVEDRGEARSELQTSEMHPETLMGAGPEGQMVLGRATELPLVRVVESIRVAIARTCEHVDRRACRESDSRAPRCRRWRHATPWSPTSPSEASLRSLPGAAHQGRRSPARGRRVREEGIQSVSHHSKRGLGSGREEESQEPIDLLVGESLAADLRVHQLGEQVTRRR